MNALRKGQNKRMSFIRKLRNLNNTGTVLQSGTCISDIPVVRHPIISCIPFVQVSFVLRE